MRLSLSLPLPLPLLFSLFPFFDFPPTPSFNFLNLGPAPDKPRRTRPTTAQLVRALYGHASPFFFSFPRYPSRSRSRPVSSHPLHSLCFPSLLSSRFIYFRYHDVLHDETGRHTRGAMRLKKVNKACRRRRY
ncbi:hypothetical protein GGR50DRAFT_671700 [Xylaria sp. CBS 124048]|nr:hypothetical protein GGR50DRAFT_671700 [Xylaria sp. CBS 124048]